jgi:hypothetical protein
MREWQEAKREYEAVPVPPELGERVQAGIRQGLAARRRAAARRRWVRSAGAFAACFAVLFAGLNLSPTFASAAADMPVVGGLLRVLTVRSYTAQDQDRTLTVSQPAVSGGDEFTKKINAEIQKRVEEETARGEETVREYKEAFLSTGGTEAEWEQHDNRVSVTYSIKSETDTTVSFIVTTQISTSVGEQEDVCYNLDVAGDRVLTLADVLGSGWVETCNAAIQKQIADSADPSIYFGRDMGGFTTVDDTTQFYLNQAGNPVVLFPQGRIAIEAAGPQEFEIQK